MSVIGKCFEQAIRLLTYEKPDAILVHGQPLGTGGDVAGERYWHAWLEEGDVVWHPTPDGFQQVDKARYYKRGQIAPAECRYYTFLEAATKGVQHEHYGPWPSPEE